MTEPTLRARLDSRGVPQHLHDGLVGYFVHRHRPGSFLGAVLSNDLAAAYMRADPESEAALGAIVRFLVNDAPYTAWGSVERVAKWLAREAA